MKRDWKILKEILQALENNELKGYRLTHDEDITQFHLDLLYAGGYIANINSHPPIGEDFYSKSYLSLKGCDLLEVMRSDVLWKQVVDTATALNMGITSILVDNLIPELIKP